MFLHCSNIPSLEGSHVPHCVHAYGVLPSYAHACDDARGRVYDVSYSFSCPPKTIFLFFLYGSVLLE